jgi:hypothetical protein
MHASAKMIAMTPIEMDRITAQMVIAPLPGDPVLPTAAISSKFFRPQSRTIIANDSVEIQDHTISNVSSMIAVPIDVDRQFTGPEATSVVLQGYTLAAFTAGMVNPVFGGLFGIGLVPGAFEIAVGDVSIQMTGTIELTFHP